jgi:hypothetical protein
VLVVVAALLVDAAAALPEDGAPPTGDVGLVGASLHAAVTTHTKPSQARTILIDMSRLRRPRP